MAELFLNFDNDRFGGLANEYDYSFSASFQGTGVQCLEILTSAGTAGDTAYAYVFFICSNGTWAIHHVGYHTEHFTIFLNEPLRSGQVDAARDISMLVGFRPATLNFYVDGQDVTTFNSSEV